MKTSTKQSRKTQRAQQITNLHANVARARKTAATLFQMAKEARDDSRAMTKEIKKLAQEQVQLKRDLKGPPKAKRPPRAVKADSRFSVDMAAEQLDNISG